MASPSSRRGSRSPQPPSRPQSSEYISTTQGLFQDLQLSESGPFPAGLDAAAAAVHHPSAPTAPPAAAPAPAPAGPPPAAPSFAAADQSLFHYPTAVPAEFSSPPFLHQHQLHQLQHQLSPQPHHHHHHHHHPQLYYPQDHFQQRPPSVVVTPAVVAPSSLQPPATLSETADMSAVTAPHFDPAFGFGGRASSTFWSDNILDQPYPSYASDASLPPATPAAAPRSAAASPQPPHASIALTVPQRELKRQRDLVRREAKAASRRHSGTPGASPRSISLELPADYYQQQQHQQHHRPSTATSAVSSSGVSSAAASPAFAPVTTVAPSSLVAIPPVAPSSGPGAAAAAAAAAASSPASSPFLSSPTAMADLSSGAAASVSGGPPGLYATSAGLAHDPQQQQQHHHHQHHHTGAYMTADGETGSVSGGGSVGHGGGAYSPPMHVQQDALFSASYQGQAYLPQYTTSPFGSPMQAQYARSMPDQQILYQMPPQPPMLHHQPPAHHQQDPMQLHHPSSAPMASPPLPGAAPMHHHHHHGVPPPLYGYGGGSDNGEGSSSGVGGVSVGGSVRAVSGGRPKPQCWEHGCNGREFSTSSNLLRHQREKSGQAAKAKCPNCGAEFTRTTARNGHMQYEKCKQRHK